MNRDIGKIRKDLKSKNCEEVYEAIYHLNRQVKLHDIMEYLDKQTKIKNIATVLKASEN